MGNYPHHIQIIADSNTWIEGNAVAQLETTARLPHMLRVAGMPDLHAGRGYPVGAAFFQRPSFLSCLDWERHRLRHGVLADQFTRSQI